jgi:hypothetical protein
MIEQSAGTGRAARDPLEPMATVVTVLCVAVSVFLMLRAYAAIRVGGAFGWGDGSVCAIDPTAEGSFGQDGGVMGNLLSQLFGPKPGISLSFIPRYCADSPGAGTRVLSTLTVLPFSALYVGALVLLYRLIRAARKDGPYTARTAGLLRVLGWYLAAGSILCHIAQSAAGSALLSSLSHSDKPALWNIADGFPGLAVLTGIGLLSFARIIRAGAAMREDLEGVI